MRRWTADELQSARDEASRRFEQIGLAMLAEAGVKRWSFHERGLWGRGSRDYVTAPKPTTRRRLYVLAHECGHAALLHPGKGRGRPTHRKEYEAEIYAHEALRRHGIAVPRASTEAAKRYVAYRIDLAVRRSTRKLDREAVAWTRGHHRAATRRALESGRVKLVDLSYKRVAASRQRVATVPTSVSLAELLRDAARQSGLSVNRLAKIAHVDQSALNRFVRGTRSNIRLDVIERLLPVLGVRLTLREPDRH